ncbi:MAG: hypothetical protein JWN82_408 [Candidatus Saccharibacteria bacterium]|nr:hypothetical protein [Candidatus Saccharibacteria bacterium]
MNTMLANEFAIDLDPEDGYGQGILLVTDVRLLLRSAVPGQYHYTVPYDSNNIIRVLNLGDEGNVDAWHIACELPFTETMNQLDKLFSCYADYYTMSKIWVDLRVNFFGANDTILHTEIYGGGEDAITFNIYCQEFWDTGSLATANWAPLLRIYLGVGRPFREFVGYDQIEAFLSEVTPGGTNFHVPYVVVRPDDTSEDGFKARGFMVHYG